MRIRTTTIRKTLLSGLATCLVWSAPVSAFAQTNPGTDPAAQKLALWFLLGVEFVLVVLTLLVLPVCAWKFGKGEVSEKRGLGLPRGSVRSMLALLIVGSTINFLFFGSAAFGGNFNQIVAGLVALSGSVTGFYFGGRTAAPPPNGTAARKPEDDRT